MHLFLFLTLIMSFTAATQTQAAIDALKAEIDAAQAQAVADPLWSLPLEELRARAEKHVIGENVSGWKNPYPTSDPRSLLYECQYVIAHDFSRAKAVLASRQTGKDFTLQCEAAADCYGRQTDWMIAAPSERQALDSLDQGRLWTEGLGMAVDDYIEEREGGSESLLKSAEIIIRSPAFTGVSRIRAVPGKPSTVRGRSANLGFTEFDFFEQPAETWRACLPSIVNPERGGIKRVRVVTTPNGKGGAMDKIINKKADPNKPAKITWSRHLITIYHAVLMGMKLDIAEMRELLDDPDGWAQEFECQFLDGSSVLLPYELIAMCESSQASETWSLADAIGSGGPRYVGIDFGRQNDPTVAWTLQRVGDKLITREVLVMEKTASPEQQTALAPRIADAVRTCFDYTGPGIGLGDYVVKDHGQWHPEAHQYGKVELCTFTTSFKRSIFPRLRQAFERLELAIPINRVIREDLHEMKQVTSSSGEFSYQSKRTADGHSDRCVALALAVRAASMGGPVVLAGAGTSKSRRSRAGSL